MTEGRGRESGNVCAGRVVQHGEEVARAAVPSLVPLPLTPLVPGVQGRGLRLVREERGELGEGEREEVAEQG